MVLTFYANSSTSSICTVQIFKDCFDGYFFTWPKFLSMCDNHKKNEMMAGM